MNLTELDYPLPEELIATQPVEPRDSCRLMVIHRKSGLIEHRVFRDLKDYLQTNDVLVMNTARVVPARIHVVKRDDPHQEFELLAIHPPRGELTQALVNPSRKARPGMVLLSKQSPTSMEIVREVGGGLWEIRLSGTKGNWMEFLDREGKIPLPPYILKQRSSHDVQPEDRDWYQTLYADREGAIAAPTAGLHFTPEQLKELQEKGIKLAKIFLRVGIGTFQPIRTEQLEDYQLPPEFYEISPEASDSINQSKKTGGRCVAVGTTAVRTLEKVVASDGTLSPGQGETSLFIHSTYSFRAVDLLLTNFHLPKTTLLALVYAFGGVDLIRKAYEEAVRERYRFFSYGDAMLILD